MRYDSPYFPLVALCAALSAAGILVIVLSSNALLKRRIFPAVLVLFSAAASLIIWEGDQFGSGTYGRLGTIALVWASEIWFYTQVAFCVDCGTLMRRTEDLEQRCPNCTSKRRTIQ